MANLAANIAAIEKVVKANPAILKFLGDLGDASHQAGNGDHTYHSNVRGKYGYPTQGVVHAIDVGMTDALAATFESWIRAEWRAGRCMGVKFINILNRQWNLQTSASAAAARAGTLKSRYSADHHLHLSMENGSVDGDLMARFVARNVNPRPGYPTLFKGTGGAGEDTEHATERYWVGLWYAAMQKYSPGYYEQITKWESGNYEIFHSEIGDVTLDVAHKLADQKGITWHGAITPQIWAIYPKVK